MASESGFSNQKKLGISQFKTIHNVGSDKYGQSVASKALYEKTPEEVIAATEIIGKSGQIEFINIYFPAHSALVNDVFRMTVGANLNFEFDVISIIDIDNFLILPLLPAIDISGDSGIIMGWVTNKANADGSQIVTLAPVPLQFVKDSVVVNVTEDTVTPANNLALPSQMVVYKDGVQYPISIDTGTPANTVGVPVILTGAAGPINITAGDLNVQLTDLGANFDASRIGDGSGNYVGVNASNQAKVIAADTDTALGLLAKLTDTQPVSIATMPTTPVTGTFFQATQPVSGPLTDAELRASSVPVSIASIPLPAGAATSLRQDTGNTSLSGIGTNTVNIPNVITTEGGVQPSHGVIVMGHTGAGIARHLLVDATGRLNTTVTVAALPTGASTLTEQQTQTTVIGPLTETAPATDTASSGLNGRLQRIAQRLTSLIALFPTSIGSKTSAASLSVVLASDQTAIPQAITNGTITTGQITVGVSAVRATVAGTAPNAARKRLFVKPSENNTGTIYIGSSSVTTLNGLSIIGPDRLEFLFSATDFYIISDVAGQTVQILEVV